MRTDVFSFGSRILHNEVVCEERGTRLSVITPKPQWAYAVEFPPSVSSIWQTGGVVEVRVRVHEGEIGLGLLTLDGGGHLCEAQVAASEESQRVELPLPSGGSGSLLLRNVSAKGNSKAEIELLGCGGPPVPAQPYWAASRITHRNAVCERDGNLLHITTPQEQWAQAVELPPQPYALIGKTGRMLKVDVRVYEGEIGLGILTPAGDGYVCESHIGAGEESILLELPLPEGARGSLALRNISASGKSKADIEFVGCEIESPERDEIAINPDIFAPFKAWSGFVPSGYFADWTGILTRADVWAFNDADLAVFNRDRHENQSVPLNREHVLDWAPLAIAVKQSGHTFRMAALGAGWGRWLAAGAALAAQLGRDYRLLGVEAESHHFEWMLRHFRDNHIPEERYIALNAAAAGNAGDCWFLVGKPQQWYGQAIYAQGGEIPAGAELQRTKSVTLGELLNMLSPLDYLHMDIQGAELDVLAYQAERLDRDVNIVNIGTHSAIIEAGLRKFFNRLGWECLYDIALGSKRTVRVGDMVIPEVTFGDGVQVWRNPSLRT